MAQSVACALSGVTGLKLERRPMGSAKALKLNAGNSDVVLVSRRALNVVSASVSRDEPTNSTSRRSMVSLLAASIVAVGAAFSSPAGALVDIKLEGPPPPSGGLPGTENADQARDTDLELKSRFFLQALTPTATLARVKEAAGEIISVKASIDKKAWPYVQNDLRSKAQYLGFDLKAIIDSKGKAEKKELVALKNALFQTINKLDYAARLKSTKEAEKYYAETVQILDTLIKKIA